MTTATLVNGPTPEMLARIEALCAAKRREIAARDAARRNGPSTVIVFDRENGVTSCATVGQEFRNGILAR